MKRIIIPFAVVVLVVLPAFAQVPTKVGQVPVYPGAKLVSARQEPTEAEIAAGKTPNFSFAAEKLWSSPDSADQVARFYASKLGTSAGQGCDLDLGDLSPGQASTAGMSVDYYDYSGFQDWPAKLRAGFSKRPKTSESDGWALSAVFSWGYATAEGDPYSFELAVLDKSLSDEDPESYLQRTEIKLSVRMFNQKKAAALLAPSAKDAEAYKADREAQEAYGKAMKEKADQIDAQAKAQNAEIDRVFGKAPTEAELGVPVYPGAAYDKDESVLRSGGSTEYGRCYAYFVKSSGDVRGTIEDVTRFYEQKTKRKRMDLAAKDMSEIPFAYFPPKQKGDKPSIKDEVVVGYNGVNGMVSIWILRKREQAAAGGR